MFGSHEVPLSIAEESFSFSFEREGETLRYRRDCRGEKVEKVLLASAGQILVNPVEPLNKPKELTPYLFIELGNTIVVEPRATKKVFAKFPVEIGIFMPKGDGFEVLDIFTLLKPKFTLYGDPRNGYVCKYFRSEVFSSKPSVDRLMEGILELNLINTTSGWTELTKAVFSAYGMKIYYSDSLVSMRANMRLKAGQIAETDFTDSPLETDMAKSREVFGARKLSVSGTKFVMELGL